MASVLFHKVTLLCLIIVFANSRTAKAGDPGITSDFLIPANVNASAVDGNFFTYTGLRGIFGSDTAKFKVSKAAKAEFPALDGQSVSFAILQFPAGGANPPHIHPRSAELLFVTEGTLEAGFVDTTNKHYNQTLQAGDLFVFPKGLVHYQNNANDQKPATAVSAFGSANAGLVNLPKSLFSTGLDDGVLAKSLKTDVATLQKIRASVSSNA